MTNLPVGYNLLMINTISSERSQQCYLTGLFMLQEFNILFKNVVQLAIAIIICTWYKDVQKMQTRQKLNYGNLDLISQIFQLNNFIK